MPHALVIIPGLCSMGLGVASGIWSSLKMNRLRRYVVDNNLAPDLTKNRYLGKFFFPAICAAYWKATRDRKTIWLTYATAAAAYFLFFIGWYFVVSDLDLPR